MSHLTSKILSRDLHVRLWSKIDTTGGKQACWNWTGSTTPQVSGYKGLYGGYGRIQTRNEEGAWYVEYAHRIVYVACVGDIPEGIYVLHTCDNPRCCNPAHLFLGTAADNAADRSAKGRDAKVRPRPAITVRNIEICTRVASGERRSDLALDYNLSPRTIEGIVLRWRKSSGVASDAISI